MREGFREEGVVACSVQNLYIRENYTFWSRTYMLKFVGFRCQRKRQPRRGGPTSRDTRLLTLTVLNPLFLIRTRFRA